MFNLEDYETVAMLNRWFVENYPMGRTNIEIVYHDPKEGFITCRAEVYRDINDVHPATTNIAHGSRDLYNSNMRRFYAEDIASSSLGRAITLLKGGQTATRDDMEKVDTNKPFEKRLAEKITVPDVSDDLWTTKTVEPPKTSAEAVDLVKDIIGGQTEKDIPNCSHGKPRILRTGTSKAGKQWAAWDCTYKANVYQVGQEKPCDPDRIWLELSSNGTWVPQKGR
jgi:hypothetical protein